MNARLSSLISALALNLVLVVATALAFPLGAQPRVTLGIECEQFKFYSDWKTSSSYANCSGSGFPAARVSATFPAVTKPVSRGSSTDWLNNK